LGLEYYRLEEDMTTSTLHDYIEPGSFELYNHKYSHEQDGNTISNQPYATKELRQFFIEYIQAISSMGKGYLT
jgi:hypothetical protein